MRKDVQMAAFDQPLELTIDLPVMADPFGQDDLLPRSTPIISLGDRGARVRPTGMYGLRPRWGTGLRGGGGPGGIATGLGMGWLARVQEEDGHWDSRKWGANRNCDAGVTGLALLAFLGHGDTDRRGKYRQTVYKALRWLEKRQASDGSFGERFYAQGICTMAASEAYALSGGRRWRRMAQKAIDYSCANQNPNGGWDYLGNNPNRVDTSVTGWMVMGIKSGIAGKLSVPTEAIERINKWLNESINADGTTGYTKNIGGKGSGAGKPATTAIATLCRIFMGVPARHQDIVQAIEYLGKRGVDLNNLYHTYYATLVMQQAMYVYPEHWERWSRSFRRPLIDRQVKGRGPELDGSWDTNVVYGGHGGRVYSTAMAVLCLEADYRYLPMLR